MNWKAHVIDSVAVVLKEERVLIYWVLLRQAIYNVFGGFIDVSLLNGGY